MKATKVFCLFFWCVCNRDVCSSFVDLSCFAKCKLCNREWHFIALFSWKINPSSNRFWLWMPILFGCILILVMLLMSWGSWWRCGPLNVAWNCQVSILVLAVGTLSFVDLGSHFYSRPIANWIERSVDFLILATRIRPFLFETLVCVWYWLKKPVF